jgi:hypothetical protein
MAAQVMPALNPLPRSTTTYRDGRGRLRRLTVVGVPWEKPDLDQFAKALLELATQKVHEDRRQKAVTRGEVKLLPDPGRECE